MDKPIEPTETNPLSSQEGTEFTLLDRLALQDAAGDIACAVADGRQPYPADLAKFRALHRKRSLHLGHEPMFEREPMHG